MRWFQAAVLVVTAAHFANLLPTLLNFQRFAFGDCGWPLTVDTLLDEGLAPTTDFAYFYGLLTLIVDRAAFAVFGRTPQTVVGIQAVCALAVAVGAARTMAAVNLRPLPAFYLVTCAALLTIPRGFPSPAHALEAALLMTAIAEHADGRLGRALVCVTVAVLVKPSLGYVYGLIFVGLILAGWPGGASRWRRLFPAAGVGITLVLVLAAAFGWGPVARTLVPLDGMKVYSDQGVGFFFGSGRLFWVPEEPTAEYYLGGVPGIWLASSVVLLVSAIRVLPRFREPAANVTLTCAALHLAFVVLLFGNRWSWIYYPYVLFVGTAVGLNTLPPRLGGVLALVLAVGAAFGQSGWLWYDDWTARRDTRPSPETAGLYATPEDAAAWAEVRTLAERDRVLVLSPMGCPQLLAPGVHGPRWWCLLPKIMTPAERHRAEAEIAAATWIVSAKWHDNDLLDAPEFAAALGPLALARDTSLYRMYRRTPVIAGGGR
jgi:hypothetical protein